MSRWTKEGVENMLEDAINELVKLVLERKDMEIQMLKNRFININK